MTYAEEMAQFIRQASWDDLSSEVRETLKIRILDAMGCAIGALEGEPIEILREHINLLGGNELCSLIGGGKSSPDRAAFYNGALIRYLDYNDSYLAKGETCHPSDNLGGVLAAAEYAGASGKDLLTALAVAYQVQCRMSDVAPVRDRGFDHVTQQAFSTTAGVCSTFKMDVEAVVNALAIAGTAYNALRVTRTGPLSHWKGLAAANTARNSVHAALLARQGITGPPLVFEGNKGWLETISGEWELDWSQEDLDCVTQTIIKKYNAEIHSQSAIEGALEIKHEHSIDPQDIEKIQIDIFDVAYKIIGGGEEGDKTVVHIKEQADHSLQYMVAVALLDDQLLPTQYQTDRIQREDVQSLLRQVEVNPNRSYSQRFPGEMPCKITIRTKNGQSYTREKRDYQGFHTRPATWKTVEDKFRYLTATYLSEQQQGKILDTIRDLDDLQTSDLTHQLAQIKFES
jgi:2-methylcitrate dehydratase